MTMQPAEENASPWAADPSSAQQGQGEPQAAAGEQTGAEDTPYVPKERFNEVYGQLQEMKRRFEPWNPVFEQFSRFGDTPEEAFANMQAAGLIQGGEEGGGEEEEETPDFGTEQPQPESIEERVARLEAQDEEKKANSEIDAEFSRLADQYPIAASKPAYVYSMWASALEQNPNAPLEPIMKLIQDDFNSGGSAYLEQKRKDAEGTIPSNAGGGIPAEVAGPRKGETPWDHANRLAQYVIDQERKAKET